MPHRSWRWISRALLFVAMVAGAVLAVPLLGSSAAPGLATAFVARIEPWIERAGFGLSQVAVTGHRFTPDADILDAVDLRQARTMLSFDGKAAKIRIEMLPWIDRASIERVIPDRLEVRVAERTPFAVWLLGSRALLIDKTGRELTAVPASELPALPRVAGKGANTAAAALLARLAAYSALRVEVAERVGERRWTLRLAGGGTIHLPQDGEAEALVRAAQLASAGIARSGEIDLRVASRPIVREVRTIEGLLESGRHAEGTAAAGRI